MMYKTPSSPRIAVIGCGHWGKNLIRNFAELGVLRAVCDQEDLKAQEFSSLYGVEACTEADVFAHPDIDALVIATSASLHDSHVTAALNASKHVYVEKPMSLSLATAKRLSSLAKEKNRLLMVGHILNYHPAFEILKERLSELGNVKHIYANRLSLGRFRAQEGVLWDLASHDISLILSLAQAMPEKIHAVGQTYLTPNKPASAFLNMEFASGLTAHLHTSWISPFKEQKFVVIGDKGIAVFDDQKPWEEKLSLSKDCFTWEAGHPLASQAPSVEIVPLPEAEPLKNECLHFLTCLQQNRSPLTCGEEGVRVIDVLEQAEHSLRERVSSVA